MGSNIQKKKNSICTALFEKSTLFPADILSVSSNPQR